MTNQYGRLGLMGLGLDIGLVILSSRTQACLWYVTELYSVDRQLHQAWLINRLIIIAVLDCKHTQSSGPCLFARVFTVWILLQCTV